MVGVGLSRVSYCGWCRGHIEGTVKEVHTDHVTKTLKGKEISRNGTEDNPAYYVERGQGKTGVVKRETELEKLDDDSHLGSKEKAHTRRQEELEK